MTLRLFAAVLFCVAALFQAGAQIAGPSPEKLLASEPPKYIVQANGKRLNSFISRDILILVEAYLASKEKKYLDGVLRYMLAASEYPDWRARQHYLSASYIVKAFGVALASCGDEMPKDVRIKLEDALMEKGLAPAEGQEFWRMGGSYAQACTSGIAYGALAIKNRFPSKSKKYLEMCIAATKEALCAYAPDGCYAEGPSYCKFATEKTDEMIALLKGHFGNDFDLGKSPGYAQSSLWMNSMVGLTGRVFNYADGGDISHTGKVCEAKTPISAVFAGMQPTATARGSDFFLAVKGGKANFVNAHMDAGSFVFETLRNGNAVRWVEDLGAERVRRIEHANIDIENYSQNSTRWSVFRYGPFSHSTFTLDGKLHNADGFVPLCRGTDSALCLVADCSRLYEGLCKSAKRHFHVDENARLTVRDEFLGLSGVHSYAFNFCTTAKAKIEDGVVVLEKGARRMHVRSTARGEWLLIDISRPAHSYESPNRGWKRIVFACDVCDGDMAVGVSFEEVSAE